MLTFDQIKELVELVSQRGLSGLEIERSGFRLKIEGYAAASQTAPAAAGGAAPAAAPAAPSAAPAGARAQLAAGGAPASPGAVQPAAAPAAAPDHVLNSPIVGTFYRAPAPDADPFVQVGSQVKKGQVLCIIEAMKLMNEIESDADGVVDKIYPQNAQAVEFGEPLFAIRTS